MVIGLDHGIRVGERCLGTTFHACDVNPLGNGLNWNILSKTSLLLVASIILDSTLRSILVVEVALFLGRHASVELLLHLL